MKHVWCAQYCHCTFEGGFEDIAICRTRAIARRELAKHKKDNPWVSGPLWGRVEKPSWMVWRVVKRPVVEK